MSLELGRPAEDDRAESAEEPEEGSQSAARSASDAPDAYADSGASPAPRFSALWNTPDTSGASEPSATADPPDDPEPGTAGPPTIPGTVVNSDTPDAPETADAPEASRAQDDADDSETSAASGDSSARGDREAPGTPAAPGVAEDLAEPVATDAPGGHSATAADDPVTGSAADPVTDAAADSAAGTAGDADPAVGADTADGYGAPGVAGPAADAARVPAQAGPEDMTGGPGAAGTTAVPEPGAAGGQPSVAARLEAAAGDLDGPLLGDVEGLRYSWQQIQIGFVDDPREAVADAAVLVEHTAQALIGALQQRQRLLRSLWDRNASLDGPGSSPAGSPAETQAADRGRPSADILDTEDLRLLIQRYRTMFNEICRP